MKPRLIFADEKEEVVDRLRQSFAGCPDLTAIKVPLSQFRSLTELDALFLTLPYAERWGAKPILFKAQVLKTKGEEEGMPAYVIAGGAFHPDQIRDARYELRHVIASVLDAVEAFNRRNPAKIRAVGFFTDIYDGLPPEEAGRVVREMYEDKILLAA
jgi:hypothetical protein